MRECASLWQGRPAHVYHGRLARVVVVWCAAAVVVLSSPCLAAEASTQPAATSAPAEAVPPALPGGAEPTKITLWQAAVLGVVEGLTEYLPVSSTGHLILTSHAMGLSEFTGERGPLGPKIAKSEAVSGFEIVIQLGAILAVLGLYRKRVGEMCLGLAGRNPRGRKLAVLLLVAFLPAAVAGLALHKPIKELLFGPVTVCWALVVGGAGMIAVELWHRRRPGKRIDDLHEMTWRHALVIGVAQCLAMWPGTSRSMITILAALVVGLDMVRAAEFSFLLALPTLGAATVFEAVKGWSELTGAAGAGGLLIGLVVSGIVAAIAVKAFVKWLTGHGLWPFGVYRIIAGVVLYVYFMR